MSTKIFFHRLLSLALLGCLIIVCGQSFTGVPVVEASKSLELEDVEIIFWHIWGTGLRGEVIISIVDEFNANNPWGIYVKTVDMGFYPQIDDAMFTGINVDERPDLVLGYANALAMWHKVGLIADLQPLIDDQEFGLSDVERADYYASTLSGGLNSSGAQVGLPISQSLYVLFYNKTWASELGFEEPPESIEDLRQQACAGAAANSDETGGIVLYSGASYVMPWIYAFGDDGLTEDSSGYDFTSQAVQSVAHLWKTMWNEGCAFATDSYPNAEFADRQALFVASSTAGLPKQIEAFDEAGNTDEWSYIPFPGPEGNKVVNVSPQYVAIVKSDPNTELATWLFMKYFTSPEVQANWVEESDYYPVRMSSENLLKNYAANQPQWLSGLKLLEYGYSEPAKPSWAAVRRAIQDAFDAVLNGSTDDVPGILEQLNATAAEILAEIEG